MAILALMTLAATVHHLDRAVADQETATLQSLAAALQTYVTTTRTIPDQTTWATNIAGIMGISPNDVLYNPHQLARQQPRVYLFDGALLVGWGSNSLPYTQNNYLASGAGYPARPVNPRLMIASSLGKTLPAAITSGVLGATDFSALWNSADNTVPTTGAWTNWPGDPTDVVVQRINLAPLFVHLVMSKYNSSSYGYYTVDGVDGTTVPTQASTVDGYFLQGSVLTLYTNAYATNMDTKQVLTADTSFVFEQGHWHSTLTGGSPGNGAANAGDVVQQFLDATPNVNAQNTNGNMQQVLVVSNMLSFMSNYNVWAYSNNFANGGGMKTYLQGLEANGLMPALQGLYELNAGGGNNYYPTNPTAINCQ
jgi:hypothetical protein